MNFAFPNNIQMLVKNVFSHVISFLLTLIFTLSVHMLKYENFAERVKSS